MANNEGTALRGDRGAYDTVAYPEVHARDIAEDAYTYHNDPANPPVTPGDLAALELDDLADVDAPAPSNTDVLSWSGAEWIAAPCAASSLVFSQVVTVTIADTTNETTIMGAGRGSKTVPANTLVQGSVLYVKVGGVVTNQDNPTMNVRFYLGGVLLCETGVFNLQADNVATDWSVELHGTCRATGATGLFIGGGCFRHDGGNMQGLRDAPQTVDTTEDLDVDVTVTWGTAHANNTISSGQARIELIMADNLAVAAPSELTATEL